MVVIISVIVLLSAGCSSFKNQEGERKIVPEQLIWQHPDSALLILNNALSGCIVDFELLQRREFRCLSATNVSFR